MIVPHLKFKYLKIFYLFILITFLNASAKTPIILMHGFIGWGRDEMNGYDYWGGTIDLESYLISEGFEVYTVSMGPISSNWDRAIEAFYQIKGGQVNYGLKHSEEYGIIQSPNNKKYDGYYPIWDTNHPVHIIAHSQGGQTARMLEYILKYNNPGEDSELLSNKHNGWIKSITTISTPHNGTILADIISNNLPFLQKITPFFGIMDDSAVENFYSFDLEQWDIDREEDESTSNYLKRLSKSPIKESKNFSAWDVSIAGAKSFNDIYETDANVYYFSYSTYSTREISNKTHIPDSNMSLKLWPSALIIGQSAKLETDWNMNDGIVNTISMKYPINTNNQEAPNKIFNEEEINKGIWQVMDPIHMDHNVVIGHGISESDKDKLKSFFLKVCERLYRLD